MRQGTPRMTLANCEVDLRRLHAEGASDAVLARSLGVNYDTVRYWRKKLGLAMQDGRSSQEYRQAAGRRLRTRVLCWGNRSPGEWAAQRRRLNVAKATGWFGAASFLEAGALDLIASSGACSSLNVATKCGITVSGAMSMLRRLHARGMVDRTQEKAGKRKNLWRLANRVTPPIRET